MRKPEGKRPLGRPRRIWEDNIKRDLQEIGGGRGDWMELAQDRDRWRALVVNGEGLSGSINGWNFLTSLLVSFSRRTLLHGVSKYLFRTHRNSHLIAFNSRYCKIFIFNAQIL